jgi:hypothetical protein
MNHFVIIASQKIKWKIYYMIIHYNVICQVQQWQFYKERMVLHTLHVFNSATYIKIWLSSYMSTSIVKALKQNEGNILTQQNILRKLVGQARL